MSSEIITKNDLKAILDTALPTQPVLSDTGWIDAPFTYYSTDQKVQYRRIGKTVEIRGAAKPTAQLAAGSDTVAFTLPLGFRPSQNVNKIQQGTNYNIWFMYINPDGTVHVARYRTGSTTEALATTIWLNMPISFTVENDAWPVTPITCADYVVEQGLNGNWNYRKWNSGRIEADLVTSNSIAMTTAIGNEYFGNITVNISNLGLLTIRNIQVTGDCPSFYSSSKVESVSLSSFAISTRSNSSMTGTVTHYIHIEGTWK